MKVVQTLFLLFLISLVYGQGGMDAYLKRLEDIKAQEDGLGRDTQLVWQYNYIGEELARRVDDQALRYFDTLEVLCQTIDWPTCQAFYYRGMGRYHDFRGEFEAALPYYSDAIEAYKEHPTALKELAFSYVLKGFLLSNGDMPDECWKTLEEGLPYARAAKGKNSLCLMLDWFGDYYYYGLADSVNNELALQFYLQVNEILPEISYNRIVADNYSCLSGVYGRLGDEEKEQYYFEKADSLALKDGLHYVRMGLYSERARRLEEDGKYAEANQIYQKIEDFMEETVNIEFKARIENSLWQNYKQLGDYEKALFHLERYIEMEDQMATDELEKKYIELESEYELSKKENEIISLSEKSMRNNRNFALGLAALALIGGVFYKVQNTKLNKSYTALDHTRQEVERALYRGETQERKRLAAELHDNVNTKLAAARWSLEAISDELSGEPQQIVHSTMDLLQSVYTDVRNISHNLVPEDLEGKGLESALSNLLRKLNTNDQTYFQLRVDNIDEIKIKEKLYPLYNIISELINNVIKHSEADNCNIRLDSTDKNLTVEVKDDGKGFDTSSSANGFGLNSLHHRVEALHGKISVNSAPGKGCLTKITIPI